MYLQSPKSYCLCFRDVTTSNVRSLLPSLHSPSIPIQLDSPLSLTKLSYSILVD